MSAAILQPVVALMIWTMIMWVWMYVTRIPALQKHPEIDEKRMVGSTGASLRAQLPERVSWKADNYNHLHEQPTLFYAVCLLLALIGQGAELNALLAWIYTGLRVVHSLVQATVNVVLVRFVLFALSSVVLIALIVHAAMAVF